MFTSDTSANEQKIRNSELLTENVGKEHQGGWCYHREPVPLIQLFGPELSGTPTGGYGFALKIGVRTVGEVRFGYPPAGAGG